MVDLEFWKDGVSVHSSSISPCRTKLEPPDDTYKIGTDRSENGPMDGLIDEVRVSKLVRSPEWISTEFNNMNDPAGFITVEAEQGIGAPIVPPSSLRTEQ